MELILYTTACISFMFSFCECRGNVSITVMCSQGLVAFKGEAVIGIHIRQRRLGSNFQLVALV